MARNNMVKIGSVWKSTKEDGTVYYSGTIDVPFPITLSSDNRILIFKNRSEHEKSPAMDVLIAEAQPARTQTQDTDNDDVPF